MYRAMPVILALISSAYAEEPPSAAAAPVEAPPATAAPVATEPPAALPPAAPPAVEAPPPSSAAPTPASGAPTPAPAPATSAPAPATSKLDLPDLVSFHGNYQLWGLNQHGFLLGADVPLDDADYVVQMMRGNLKVGSDGFFVTTRFDAAQGWWGVDNEPESELVTRAGADGVLVDERLYNPYALFRNKETNYTIHFDHAFATIQIPKTPITVKAGRQPYALGHMLVLDMDLDGVQVQIKAHKAVEIGLFWALMSEGKGSYKYPLGTLMTDKDGNADANLFGIDIKGTVGPMKLGLFAAAYLDGSGKDDTGAQLETYLPNGLGYGMSRFKPNLSTVVATGLTADGVVPVLDGLTLAAEVDVMWGEDHVANTTFNGGLMDVNNGNLFGYNLLFRAEQAIKVDKTGLRVGALVGVGSGDGDPSGGGGNINGIQSQGQFTMTNVWEDSIMPDVGGISPQGLGSPVSRGYRELENTTALQAGLGVTPVPALSFDASYTWLHATTPIHAFDSTGAPTADTSSALGHEVDVNAKWRIYKKVSWDALFGVFLPGDGAGYLINGNADSLKPAWELKQVVSVGF